MVELVIADIDGTLRGFERAFGDMNRKALQLCHQKGIRLAVASGRPLWQELEDHAKEWNLGFQFDLIIGMNGGQIYDTVKNTKKEIHLLTPAQLELIVHALHDFDLNPFVYREGYSLVLHMDEEMVQSGKRHHSRIEICQQESDLYSIPTGKILYRTPTEKIALEVEHVGKQLSGEISCFRTGPTLVEFQSVFNNKGEALAQYCRENNIDIQNTLAFGDAENDMEMLQMAGKGVAVKNALEPVKKIADEVTAYTAGEDGVGRYLLDRLHLEGE